jgi:hypothetical protein
LEIKRTPKKEEVSQKEKQTKELTPAVTSSPARTESASFIYRFFFPYFQILFYFDFICCGF